MKPLFIPLKKEWFEQFKSGIKTTEYRLYGPRWHEGTIIPGRKATLSLGYNGARINATVIKLRKITNKSIDFYPKGAILAAIDLRIITA